MLEYKNLIIIGTSHIARQSVEEVEHIILQEKPGIVALELDPIRYESLIHNKKEKNSIAIIKQVGIKGYLFNMLGGYIERKLGKMVGTYPGVEMKKAVDCAKIIQADIALIDQDVRITLQKLSKHVPLSEKFRLFWDVLFGTRMRKNIKFDLTKVPDDKLIKKLTNIFKKRYPNFYKVLIGERDIILAKRLYRLMQTNKKIVAVIGAGHKKVVIDHISRLYHES